MNIMANVSTNIIRDQDRDINYIVTPNTKEVFYDIFKNENKAQKSYTLVGNYGTGKSSFLWAIKKNLQNQKHFFVSEEDELLNQQFEFVEIIGENQPLEKSFVKALGNKQDIQSALQQKWEECKSKNASLVIFIDEFGKHLEYFANNEGFEELYILQKIAEWVNDSKKDIYFVITLHQDFLSYSSGLSKRNQQEWEKIKGRFIELAFNEPIEQLIYFASEELKKISLPNNAKENYKRLNDLIINSNLTHSNDFLNKKDITLFPLDGLSTHLLVNSLQRYGQNERSLFTFLNNKSKFSVESHNGFYNVADVYDYLVNQLSTFIASPYNPHRAQWATTQKVLERAELTFNQSQYKIAEEVIKLIGLSNIFARQGGLLDREFIEKYLTNTKGFNANEVLDKLFSSGLIRFYNHANRINFLDGTDIDLEFELLNISKELNKSVQIGKELLRLVDLPIVLAKKYSFQRGSNRFFEFKILSDLSEITNGLRKGIDGNIYIVLDDIPIEELEKKSIEYSNCLFVLHSEVTEIKEDLYTVLKYEKLLEKFKDDKNAVKLINSEKHYQILKLKDILLEHIYEKNNSWINNGEKLSIKNKNELNHTLSNISEQNFSKTPFFRNELINKEFISTPIKTARKRLLREVLNNEAKENLGFPENKFPAEKSIYLSLLKATGVHQYDESLKYYKLDAPIKNSSFNDLWLASEEFIETALLSKQKISKLNQKLLSPPYKLKKGFVNFWVPIFLIAKKEEFALFHAKTGFIPFLSEDTISLIIKKPEDFLIKAYDVSGLKLNLLEGYKELVNISNDKDNGTRSTFISIYANFLRFYRSLNEYSKKTNSLSPQTLRLREAIKDSKDPEEALFINFPIALGFDHTSFSKNEKTLLEYTNHIQSAIEELKNAYPNILDKIEKVICSSYSLKEMPFNDYKPKIQDILNSIDPIFLSQEQSNFYKRMISPLDERDSWLKSVADVAIGKPINKMIDDEVPILIKNLRERITGLIKASEIQSFNESSQNQKLISLRLFDPNGSFTDQKVIIKQNQNKELKNIINKLQSELINLTADDKKEVLVRILSEEFSI